MNLTFIKNLQLLKVNQGSEANDIKQTDRKGRSLQRKRTTIMVLYATLHLDNFLRLQRFCACLFIGVIVLSTHLRDLVYIVLL